MTGRLRADIVYFDIVPPLQYVGSAALRERFSHWFDGFEGSIGQDVHDLTIVMSGDVAVASMLIRASGTRKDGHEVGFWVRATSSFQRSDNGWLITHEHVSLPVDLGHQRGVELVQDPRRDVHAAHRMLLDGELGRQVRHRTPAPVSRSLRHPVAVRCGHARRSVHPGLTPRREVIARPTQRFAVRLSPVPESGVASADAAAAVPAPPCTAQDAATRPHRYPLSGGVRR